MAHHTLPARTVAATHPSPGVFTVKKLSLNVDALEVASFDTGAKKLAEDGTVQAHGRTLVA